MSDLFPTKTRLALLQAVADEAVYQSRRFPYESDECVLGSIAGTHRWMRVTSRCKEAHQAGWIELEPEDMAGRWSRRWLLTDAGRAVLERA